MSHSVRLRRGLKLQSQLFLYACLRRPARLTGWRQRCSNVHRLLSQFPEVPPSDSCPLRGGTAVLLQLLSGSHELWNGIVPDHRFNSTLWYTRSLPPSTRTGTWYPKTEPQSLTLGVWVPFSAHYLLDLNGICFKVRKKTLPGPTSRSIAHRNDKCWWHIFFADSLVDCLTLLNEAHKQFWRAAKLCKWGKINTDLCENCTSLAGRVPPGHEKWRHLRNYMQSVWV